MNPGVAELEKELEANDYIADPAIATALYLATAMQKPLLVEGDAGVGKTELAKVLSRILDTELIRLQCYEGLDVQTALYEWDYPRQLLALRLAQDGAREAKEAKSEIFAREYLLERPLLRAISRSEGPAVLLIDEIDRADDAFEAFLLELLSDFQVTIPELGTLSAAHHPHVLLTSNRTRELGDALRRRCLYLYIEHPSFEKEVRILKTKLATAPDSLVRQVGRLLGALRVRELVKPPGIAESLDFTRALLTLGRVELDATTTAQTLGCLLKDRHDLDAVGPEVIAALVEQARIAERP